MEILIVNPEIISENENAARDAFNRGDYVICFLLIHSLIESLLRAFLGKTGEETFNNLIKSFNKLMKSEGQNQSTFINELSELNRRRNRVIHELWAKGYSVTNENLKNVCQVSFMVFGLLIDWISTFNPEIIESGFDYENN